MIKVIAPFILSFLIPYFAHAQSCKSILGASINRETILMEIASLSQDVEQAKLNGDTIAFISLESSLKEKITEILNLGIVSDEELKLSLNNQSEELIKKAKEELKDKKENREIQKNRLDRLALITEFTDRFKFEDDFISWFEDFKNFNEADQKTFVTELDKLKNQDEVIAEKIKEVSLLWDTDLEIYKEILKSKLVKIIDFGVKARFGFTVIRWASLFKEEQQEVLNLIFQNGIDAHARGVNGNTNLHSEVQSQKEVSVELLIKYGADVNAKNDQGNTPLHIIFTPVHGSYGKEEKIIKLLVKNGANVHAVNNNGETALDLATSSSFKNSNVIKFLKKEMAKP